MSRESERKAAQREAALKRRPWIKWYASKWWRETSESDLRENPFCAFHLKAGEEVPATVVDHVHPHRGNWFSFRYGKRQNLCGHCHSSVKQSMERGNKAECGPDGFPVDPGHAWNVDSEN